jgi:TolB-like protein
MRHTLLIPLLALAACGGPPRFQPTVPPGEQAGELRAWFEEDRDDVDARAEYGRALVASEEWDAVLGLTGPETPAEHRADPRIRVLRGIALEETGELEAAADLYTGLRTDPSARSLHPEVEARLRVVNDEILREQARSAVAREEELADSDPSGTTLAVLPFRVSSSQPGFEPLGRAFAELLVTDLALAERFQVLERVRVQALVDELNLGGAGLAEPETAARSGRLLGAGNLVQGTLTLTPERIRSDAAVVRVPARAPGVDPFTNEAAAEALMALEARTALDILAELGVQLTPAEEARIVDRPTVRLESLLAFGRGLREYDLGNLEAAEAEFARAVQIDPNLALVRGGQLGTPELTLASAERLAELALRNILQDRSIDALRARALGARANVLRILGQNSDRVPLTDGTGAERVAPTATFIELLFRRPGG